MRAARVVPGDGDAAAAGLGSPQGRGLPGAGPERSGPGSSLGRRCLLPTCAFPQSLSPSPPSGPGLPPRGPLGTPRVTPTLRRPVPTPGVAGRGALPALRVPVGKGVPPPVGMGSSPPAPRGIGPEMDVYVFASAAAPISQGQTLAPTVAMLML